MASFTVRSLADGRGAWQVVDLLKDDVLPAVEFQWVDEDGDARDLSGVTAVDFRMRARDADQGSYKVDAACTEVDFSQGQVKWEPAADDLDTAGEYYARLVADFGASGEEGSEEFVVRIWEDL